MAIGKDDLIKVKQIAETEYLVGKNQTSLIKGNIIQIIVEGEQTKELAEKQWEIDAKLAALVEGKVSFLVDLNKSGKNSPEARAMWNKICEPDKIEKAAVFGLNPVARVIAAFVIGVAKTNKQRFFRTREDAIKWLMNE